MAAADNLGSQFSSRIAPGELYHSELVSREEHEKAIADAQGRDPERFWTVSAPPGCSLLRSSNGIEGSDASPRVIRAPASHV